MAQSAFPDLHKGTNQYPIPATSPNAQPPGYIVYLNVWYNVDDTSDWYYQDNSGIYPPQGIHSFVQLLQNGGVDIRERSDTLPPPASGQSVPVVLLQGPCHIVFAIDIGTPGFNLDSGAGPTLITTSCNNGTEYFSVKPETDVGGDAVHIVHFRANSPAQVTIDGFNLNLIDGVIDPDIKNTGRPPGTHVQ